MSFFTRLKNSHFPNFKVICQFCLSTFNIYLKNSLFPIDFWQVCWIIILKTALLTCVRVGYIFVFAVVVVCESNLWPNPTKSPLSVTFFFQMFWCWKCKIWCSKMIHYMSFVVESHIFPFHLNTFNSEKKIFWKFLYFLLILDHILKRYSHDLFLLWEWVAYLCLLCCSRQIKDINAWLHHYLAVKWYQYVLTLMQQSRTKPPALQRLNSSVIVLLQESRTLLILLSTYASINTHQPILNVQHIKHKMICHFGPLLVTLVNGFVYCETYALISISFNAIVKQSHGLDSNSNMSQRMDLNDRDRH